MIKLVVIDFDDTLCLTEAACFDLENDVAKEIGMLPMTRELHLMNWGKPFREVLPERFPGVDVDKYLHIYNKRIAERINNAEFDVISDINLTTLQTLRENKIKIAILTSRELFEVEHLLHEDHILNKYIDAFYHKDNTKFHKPHPQAFDEALKAFRVLPDEVVYIGDNLGDGVSSKGAGLHFIALLESGFRSRQDFKSVEVDFFAQTFPDILTYILPKD